MVGVFLHTTLPTTKWVRPKSAKAKNEKTWCVHQNGFKVVSRCPGPSQNHFKTILKPSGSFLCETSRIGVGAQMVPTHFRANGQPRSIVQQPGSHIRRLLPTHILPDHPSLVQALCVDMYSCRSHTGKPQSPGPIRTISGHKKVSPGNHGTT